MSKCFQERSWRRFGTFRNGSKRVRTVPDSLSVGNVPTQWETCQMTLSRSVSRTMFQTFLKRFETFRKRVSDMSEMLSRTCQERVGTFRNAFLNVSGHVVANVLCRNVSRNRSERVRTVRDVLERVRTFQNVRDVSERSRRVGTFHVSERVRDVSERVLNETFRDV